MTLDISSQVTAMKEKAEKDIAQERRKAVNGIKGEIGGMAVEIAGKVIELFFSGKIIETATINSGSLCHDASPTFSIKSLISFV